jgi:hypothetical protein
VLSLTVTLTVNVPAAVGVPDKTPPEERLTPPGNPVAVQVNGGTPPPAESVPLNGDPKVGVGIVDVVTVNGAAAMVNVKERDMVARAESVTVTVTVNVPASVGVPLSTPADEAVTPLGVPLTDHVYGDVPPLAAKVAE